MTVTRQNACVYHPNVLHILYMMYINTNVWATTIELLYITRFLGAFHLLHIYIFYALKIKRKKDRKREREKIKKYYLCDTLIHNIYTYSTNFNMSIANIYCYLFIVAEKTVVVLFHIMQTINIFIINQRKYKGKLFVDHKKMCDIRGALSLGKILNHQIRFMTYINHFG